jgi:hypothetical protein
MWQAVQGRLDREWPHRGVKYNGRLFLCRGHIERIQEIAANFARPNLDLIVTAGPQPLRALLAASQV